MSFRNWVWIGLLGVLACGPTAGGGGPQGTAQDAEQPKDDKGGSVLGSDIVVDPGDGDPVLTVFLADEGVFSETVYALDAITPGSGKEQRIKVELANFGEGLLTLSSVKLAQINGDGKPKNLWVSLQSKEVDLDADLPVILNPHSLDVGSVLSFEVVYSPKQFDENHATLVIESNDPNAPERKILFKSQPALPKIRIKPNDGFFWFATPLEPETLTFEIHNDGTAPLLVTSVALNTEFPAFSMVEDVPGGVVEPSGKKSYAPLKFAVKYAPEFGKGGGNGVIRIESNDSDGPVDLKLVGKYNPKPNESPCSWKLTAGEGDELDFSDIKSGVGTHKLVMHNLGTDACTLKAVTFPGDVDGLRYSWSAAVPGADGQPVNVTELPATIGLGKELQLTIQYAAGDTALNSPVVIEFSDPADKSIKLNAIGGGPKPCLELGPGTSAAPQTLEFAVAPNQGVGRSMVMYNCGDGPLTVQSITIHDENTGDEPSNEWAITSPGAGLLVIPEGNLQVFKFIMAAHPDAMTLNGKASITWLNINGPETLDVNLKTIIAEGVQVPVANPGNPSDFADAQVGIPFILDGSKSETPSTPLNPTGYTWTMIGRPAGSKLIVNGPPAGPKVSVTADVAGNYMFALTVTGAGSPAYVSAEAIMQVTVAEKKEEVQP